MVVYHVLFHPQFIYTRLKKRCRVKSIKDGQCNTMELWEDGLYISRYVLSNSDIVPLCRSVHRLYFSPDVFSNGCINMHVLLTVLHIFRMVLAG